MPGSPIPFVLNELVRLQSGANPDASHRKLPAGLSKAIGASNVGMFGHGLGGAMAAQAMAADSRIYAGIDLDGTILVKKRSLNPKLDQDLARRFGHRPFMLFTRQGHDARDDPTLAGFWAGLKGRRLFLALREAQHFTFTDFEEFLSQLLAAGIRPDTIRSAAEPPQKAGRTDRPAATWPHASGDGGAIELANVG
jgi:hypothetical protein